MHSIRRSGPVRVGLVADEPIRLEGLTSVFEEEAGGGHTQLLPVMGSMKELLALLELEYLVVDISSSSGGVSSLEAIRQVRPDIRLIVIGPEGDDELVIDSIIAGARAYLDLTASTATVRQAIEVVTSGSIWAPRRLLSTLIDRLLSVPEASLIETAPHLTDRERQVLELLLMARSNREIADQLGIEERTVKAHVSRLMRKTGADNRIELSVRALSRSLMGSATAAANGKASMPLEQVT